jgi:vancomycin resistance protein YoaR
LVEALKPFTAEAGYRPELVIKGNKLLPEIGGGACQIGTTTFRAALSSGLEITQRRNHSFAVSYYNDENGLPGADATIYDPWPDFKFINNTPAHVLIQTHVEGDELIYEFWGTSDGRQASTTKPAILARQSAPPTNYIETTDLPVGTTSCSGSNVPGYTTTFTYTVVMPDGEEKVENFDSYYKPWQKICLVGVEKKESELVD